MKQNKVVVLTNEVNHVLTVPSRYIGSISMTDREDWVLDGDKIIKRKIMFVPGFMVLFKEIVSNTIDEFIRTNGAFANKIDVSLSEDRMTIIVRDNGRGISHESAVDEHGNNIGTPQSVVAFTRLKAGTNFEEKTTSIGQNGEGCSLTAIFSKNFHVETSDGVKKTVIDINDNRNDYTAELSNCKKQFTEVTWRPDFERLNMAEVDTDTESLMRKFLLDLNVSYPAIKFTWNKKPLPARNFKEYVAMYGVEDSEIFSYDNMDVAFLPSYDYEQVSWVNGIYTRRGGTHVESLVYWMIGEYRKLVEKRYPSLKPADVKNKIMVILNIRNFVAPRFDSQTKEELINDKSDFDMTVFDGVDLPKIAQKIFKNKAINDNILQAFRIKEELKKRQELKDKEKKIQKIDNPKLIETNHPVISERSIYIAEGDSALVNFLSCREPWQAAYPLTGKVPNSKDKEAHDLSKSKKIMDLCKVLGLKLSSKNIDDLQYGKIILFTDADYDGDSIKCLLLNLFMDRWPDLIRSGKVYIAVSPLIKAVNNVTKKIKYFYDNASFRESGEDWSILEYNKGLGSLEEDEYKMSLNNLVQVICDDQADESLMIAFGRDSQPRKEWMMR